MKILIPFEIFINFRNFENFRKFLNLSKNNFIIFKFKKKKKMNRLNMKLLPFEKDIVNFGFTSVDNVILRVTI